MVALPAAPQATSLQDRLDRTAARLGVDEVGQYRLNLHRMREAGVLVDLTLHGFTMFTRRAGWLELGIPVADVRASLTPQLRTDLGPTDLIGIDLGRGRNRLGGSALAQVYGQLGDEAADLDEPALLSNFFAAIQQLNREGMLLAYHDRSDGGLLITLCEMAFAGRTGLRVELDALGSDPFRVLFSEEPGAVIQVRSDDRSRALQKLAAHGLSAQAHLIGSLGDDDRIVFRLRGCEVLADSRAVLHRTWSETTYRMQILRDHCRCAAEQFDGIAEADDPGLSPVLPFDPADNPAAPLITAPARPRVAILREQGVNGQVEMAAAFDRAGFDAVDVHMSDILAGRVCLREFRGLAACGGFSYGDVLGGGQGWAKSILFNPPARQQLHDFFLRPDTFTLGVCNGCQMMAGLSELVPGADHWPFFVQNLSEQFEARLITVAIEKSPSVLLSGMQGARLPVVVAHGEGRADFGSDQRQQAAEQSGTVAVRFATNRGTVAERYPENPNGSPAGITGLCSRDGRATIMMPHPERLFRTVQHSWHPPDWPEDSPWMRLFYNARVWVGQP
jgi:phosphoribosylformylglycinamidine synthase